MKRMPAVGLAAASLLIVCSLACLPAAYASPKMSDAMKRELKWETSLGANQTYNVNAPYLDPDVEPVPGLVAKALRITASFGSVE